MKKISITKWLMIFIMSVSCLCSIVPVRALADDVTDCVKAGNSQLDCEALYGPWTAWVPDDGTDSCSGSATAGASFTDFKPDPKAVTIYTNQLKDKIQKLAPLYQAAAKADNIADWEFLAAVHDAETGGGLGRTNPTTNTNYRSVFQMNSGTLSGYGADISKPTFTPGHTLTDAEFIEAGTYAGKFLKGKAKSLNIDLSKPLGVIPMARVIAAYNLGEGNVYATDVNVLPGDAYVWAGWNDTSDKLPMSWKSGNFGQATPYRVPGGITVVGLIRAGGGIAASGSSCGGGVVAGNIAKTAVSLAWDDYGKPGGHTHSSKGASQAQPAFVAAVAKYNKGEVSYSESAQIGYSDCGVFVATVMRASGVDPNYTAITTGAQLTYVQAHPEKYTVYKPGAWGTKAGSAVQPQVGDIFVTSGHTYIYVGKQSDGYSVAEASQFGHVPEIDSVPYTQQDIGNGPELFYLVRVKS